MMSKAVRTPLVAVYARQSVTEDEGIQQQVAACTAEAKARGWNVVDNYRDNATSATKARGPKSEWARMLRDIDAGRINTVLVVAVDRLLRRLADVIEIRDRGVRVVVVRGGIDTSEPSGSFTLSMLALLAEQEIETKSARAVPYRVKRHGLGVPTAGKVPFGYRWVPSIERAQLGDENIRWLQVPEQAKVVRRIFKEALKTDKPNIFGIVQMLGKEKFAPPTGTVWRSSTVRRILLNPAYAGLLAPTTTVEQRAVEGYQHHAERVSIDDCTPGNWKPIVTEDQVRTVRARLTDKTRKTNGGVTARKWLLGGLAFCTVCYRLVRSATTREGHHGYRCPAGHFLRRGTPLDTFVTAVVLNRLLRPDAVSLLAPAPAHVDVDGLRARRGALAARRTELLSLVAVGTFTAVQVSEYTEPIDAEISGIEAQLAAVNAADPLADVVGHVTMAELVAVWRGLSLARQRAIIEALVIVGVRPVGKGSKLGTLEAMAESTLIAWRGPNGEHYTLESVAPMPADVIEAVSTALG